MTARCRYHARCCGGHFTSLEAFDAHRSGPPQERVCSYPDDAGLVEIPDGICAIADPTAPATGVTVYSTERAGRAKEHFGGVEAAQALSARRKGGR